MAYFNNAATTYPKPAELYDAMISYYRYNGVSIGREDSLVSKNAETIVQETRNQIKMLLQCDAKEVIFQSSATMALNIIIQGIIKSGVYNIYISPFEHNAVTRILYNFEKQNIIRIHKLLINHDLTFDFERIKYQFDAIKPDLVIVSHASNVIGLLLPVEEIFTLAKKYDSITLIDMAQTAGLVNCNLNNEIFDYVVFAGHKTLYGPTGISGFLMKPDLKLTPILFGGTGYDSANQDMPHQLPERFEIGTINLLGIAGLYSSLNWIETVSINNIRTVEKDNRKKLVELLSKYWFIKLIGNNESLEYVGIVSCLIDGISSDSAGVLLNKYNIQVRTGLHCAPLAHQFLNTYPTGTIRFSVSYFTSEKDFNELEHALDNINKAL